MKKNFLASLALFTVAIPSSAMDEQAAITVEMKISEAPVTFFGRIKTDFKPAEYNAAEWHEIVKWNEEKYAQLSTRDRLSRVVDIKVLKERYPDMNNTLNDKSFYLNFRKKKLIPDFLQKTHCITTPIIIDLVKPSPKNIKG